jgi:DUF4097 and DUF4098 domain-containing protein YvlB
MMVQSTQSNVLPRWIICVAAGVLLLLTTPEVQAAGDDYFVRVFEGQASAPVKAGDVIVVENSSGPITIKTWEKQSIEVTATLEMINLDEANRNLFEKETRVDIQALASGYVVEVVTPKGIPMTGAHPPRMVRGTITEHDDGTWSYTPSAEIALEVSVPRFLSVDLRTSYGDVAVDDIEGDVTVANESGTVILRRIGGRTEVENKYGSIEVSDAQGDVIVNSSSSGVVVENIGGAAEIRASYDDVVVRHTAGAVRIVNESGGVEAVDIGGELGIECSYEDVIVKQVAGPVTVACPSASLDLEDVHGTVEVTGSYAPIEVKDVDGDLIVRSQSSRVNVGKVTGDVDVAGSYETIDLADVDGEVRVEANSSPVTVVRVGRNVSIRTSYGEIKAAAIDGALDVDGSSCSVVVDGVKGDLTVNSSYEYVTVTGTESSIDIEGDSSPVEISKIIALPIDASIHVRTSYNKIVLELPESVSAEVVARSSSGEIESAFPMTYDRKGDRKAMITIGQGESRIRLRTSDDIQIEKAR